MTSSESSHLCRSRVFQVSISFFAQGLCVQSRNSGRERGFPRPRIRIRPGGKQVKGAGQTERICATLKIRRGTRISCGVGLRGFESHPPHQFTGIRRIVEGQRLQHQGFLMFVHDFFNTGTATASRTTRLTIKRARRPKP